MKIAAITAVLVALCIAAALAYGSWSWGRATAALGVRMNPTRSLAPMAVYDERDIAGLPPPVQRFFRAALQNGQSMVASARFKPHGDMRMKEADPAWTRFSSDQMVVVHPPGFDWDARIRMGPGVNAFVHDAYVERKGMLLAKVLGLVPVANVAGTKAMAEAELMRYLAEAAWYPTALLPSQGVTWTPIDDNNATATLIDGANRVSLEFGFDAAGMIVAVYTPARYHSDKDGVPQFSPWGGEFFDHFVQGGMRIPARGQVGRISPAGAGTYWRGRIDHVEDEFAPPAGVRGS
jgi:hypothetical protein